MANFALNNSQAGSKQNLSSAYKTLVSITAQTTGLRRAKLFDILLGTIGTPADNELEFDLSRQTTLGTGTNAVPSPHDPADQASSTVGTVNYTTEPTITANQTLFYLPINQRASYRWVTDPERGFVVPAVNLAGLALRAQSAAYTSTAGAHINFADQ